MPSRPPSREEARALRLLGLDPGDPEVVEQVSGLAPFERARRTGQPVSRLAYAAAEGLRIELRADPDALDAPSTTPDAAHDDDEPADRDPSAGDYTRRAGGGGGARRVRFCPLQAR